MTPEAQRMAIAEACGINTTDCREQLERFKGRPDYSDAIFQLAKIPNYLSDLNTMHEAEKVLTPKQWNQYVVNLARVIAEAKTGEKVSVPTNVLISATAAQRAEAFLRTLNLWKD